ncbi:homocysteine S-methyltransferase [Corynebacterium uterequi]|uniref:Homocysteine S-methyltransferase n=1 Tax=Corynebacterium uterequi TaxID=1072256 RepID=A0A0G3HC51_9CORY|nr:homocysteine S-methyltransferase [Corynebacterium uterequi]AKK10966.1 homocysteine S-methyltransferase [Corynebacterium uterequi]
MSSFLQALADGTPITLDGGLGTHLAARGNDVTGQLWSAAILRSNPDEVRAAHADFFAAGADVATTCSYQVTFDAVGEEAEELLRRSVALAAQARTRPGQWIAASIGPYGAGPGAGTEYDGAYGLSVAELAAWHRRRIEVLSDTEADVLWAETVPSILEVQALVAELGRVPKPAVLSVTVDSAGMRDGTSLTDLAEVVSTASNLVAVGVNCSSAEDALAAVRQLDRVLDLPLAAYPNSGEVWDHEARSWHRADDDARGLLECAGELRSAGVRLLGGCCRVTPREIAVLAGQS